MYFVFPEKKIVWEQRLKYQFSEKIPPRLTMHCLNELKKLILKTNKKI